MRKFFFAIILLIAGCSLQAQTPKELMQQGNDAYAKSNFTAAINAYNAVLNAGFNSADLYYNLGNAYYRLDEFGLAILNYERALALKPNFRDARQNLELANSKTEDEISVLPEFFAVRWAHAVVSWLSPAGWLILTLIILAIVCGLTVVFILSQEYHWRKTALIAGIVFILLLIISIACAANSNRGQRHNKAIVTSPMIVVKSSPESTSIDKLILHEGTKVAIDETLGDWHKIHIADGNTGWVEDGEITII